MRKLAVTLATLATFAVAGCGGEGIREPVGHDVDVPGVVMAKRLCAPHGGIDWPIVPAPDWRVYSVRCVDGTVGVVSAQHDE